MSDDAKGPFWQTSYEIGYGKPPIASRFVKGKSGNPRGRPRKSPSKPLVDRSTRDRFLSVTERSVTIREGDNLQKVPLVEAIMRAESVAALKGNTHAQRNFLEREARYRKDLSAEIREEHDLWRKYAATYEEKISALLKAGHSIPEGLPHPDDLVFEDGCHVMIRGGDPLEAARDRDLRIRLRDAYMLQAEKDRRYFCSSATPPNDGPIFISEILAERLNSSLPKRLQLDDFQLVLRMDRARSLKKRDLEQRLRRVWADLGFPNARNFVTPPVNSLLVTLGIDAHKLRASRDGRAR